MASPSVFHAHVFSIAPMVRALVLAGLACPPLLYAQVAPQAEPATLPTVLIGGQRATPASQTSSVGAVGDAPQAQTPQSISVLRSEQLREEGASSWAQVLRSEPSVGNFYNTTGYIETLQIRGFVLDNRLNFRRDGLPVSNHQPLALENKQAVEFLRGVSGIQSGSSAPGGLVNLVLKRPTLTPLREVFLGFSERGSLSAHADLGGRSADGIFGYRINFASAQLRPTARTADGRREFMSGFFDWRVSPSTTLEAEFEWQQSRQFSVPGIGLLDVNGDGVGEVVPSVPSPRLNLGAQPWAQPFESRSLTGSLRMRQVLNSQWSWGAKAGQQVIRTQDRLAFPDGCSNAPVYVYPGFCANGDADVYDYRSNNERRISTGAEVFLKGDIQTGVVRHELTMGVAQSTYRERYEFMQAYNYVGSTNLFAPVVLPQDPTPTSLNTQLDSRSTDIFVYDAMRFNQQWSLWAGLRHSRLNRGSVRTDGTNATQLDQQFTTPWAALGYQWDAQQFIYLAAGQGTESEVVPNRPTVFSNFGVALPVLRSSQFELGYKRQLDRGGLFSATWFSISKPFSDDVTQASGLLERQAGAREQRHQGLELAWLGWLTSSTSLQAQTTWLDATTVRSLDASLLGKQTPNTSKWAGAATLNWQVPELTGVTWSNRVSFASAKPVNRDNSTTIPGWAQLDSWIGWRTKLNGQPWLLRAGIDNVFDRRFWRDAPTQSWGGVYLFPAPPRTYRVSMQVSF